jgi:hypothetical protein
MTQHQANESSSLSGIITTREAVSSSTVVEGASLTTRLETGTATSYINIANIEATKPQASTETVEDRTANEPEASLQVGFLVLGAILALASVVVAVFFGHKQLSITREQLTARRNISARSDDVELGQLDVISGGAVTAVDLTTRNCRTVDEGFISTVEELKAQR